MLPVMEDVEILTEGNKEEELADLESGLRHLMSKE